MKKYCCLLFALITVVLISSCQRELSSNSLINTPSQELVATAIVGRITDELNKPITGATVIAGASSTVTDANGNFKIANAIVYDLAAVVKVEKVGYFKGSRTFHARQNQEQYVEIMLLTKQSVGEIPSTTGGSITLGNGSAITLAANSVVNASSGASYSGTVAVAMAWIDPTSPNLERQMPGDLRGIDANSVEQGLKSYGMLDVELTGSNGEKLQIAAGKKASLSFPLPSAVQGSAPSSIALWSFNDATGLWQQEGNAIRVGNFYKAEVSHFSFWNCDAPFPLANFEAVFIDQNQQPLKNVLVYIVMANGYAACGWTDSAGYIYGKVPSNENLTLHLKSGYDCATPFFTQNMAPMATGTNNALGNITVTIVAASAVTVSGTVVDCSNLPITNGFVDIKVGAFKNYRAALSITGSFSLSFVDCSSTPTITYCATNLSSSQQSAPVSAVLSAGNNNLGQISACGISTEKFIHYTLDGIDYSIVAPGDSISTYDDSSTSGGLNAKASVMWSNFNNTQMGSFSFSGSFPDSIMVQKLFVYNNQQEYVFVTQNNPIKITATEYSTLRGGYIAGSFNAICQDSGTTITHTFNCRFRINK